MSATATRLLQDFEWYKYKCRYKYKSSYKYKSLTQKWYNVMLGQTHAMLFDFKAIVVQRDYWHPLQHQFLLRNMFSTTARRVSLGSELGRRAPNTEDSHSLFLSCVLRPGNGLLEVTLPSRELQPNSWWAECRKQHLFLIPGNVILNAIPQPLWTQSIWGGPGSIMECRFLKWGSNKNQTQLINYKKKDVTEHQKCKCNLY